ncbi:hypothetical protein LJB42_003698 [Komagataella kurtzmanii]|nr:hypothetical protein LJB42_003698 [Komagataella kurtzmanii]
MRNSMLRISRRCFNSSGLLLNPSPTRTRGAVQNLTDSLASNPQLSFPCLDKQEKRSKTLLEDGPEPSYQSMKEHHVHKYKSEDPIFLDYGGYLPKFEIAYETWGRLNEHRDNAILIHTGLSASSHAKSNALNLKKGWWEEFIGPGKYLDTTKYFIICTNVIGGCYGSTGPSSIDPADGKRYATRFPIVSINDMVRAQNRLVSSHFGIKALHASVGASMGGMQSLAYAHEFPDQVNKIVSISGCARSHPYSIAMRFCQRQVLMSDPNWNRGFYYDSLPPHTGMKLARQIATITYRSGPEWEVRFGVERTDPSKQPALCPDFIIENYLDHQGEKFCLQYDPNSLLYVSKAMDLFDLGAIERQKAELSRSQAEAKFKGAYVPFEELQFEPSGSNCSLPSTPYEEKPRKGRRATPEESRRDLLEGLKTLAHKDVLVIGVESDILFPAWQQREISDLLTEGSKELGLEGSNIRHVELGSDVSIFGHDTFLLSLDHIGKPVSEFLS